MAPALGGPNVLGRSFEPAAARMKKGRVSGRRRAAVNDRDWVWPEAVGQGVFAQL